MIKAVLDANVLYPTVLRTILLGAARRGLFAPLWSARILEEWARATVKLGPGAEDIAHGEIAALKAEWPEADVPPDDELCKRLWLPDPADIHVLAAAVRGNADVIITFNARDFPRHLMSEQALVRVAPDQFLLSLQEQRPDDIAAVCDEVRAEAERLSGVPQPLRTLLKRAGLPRLARRLSPRD